MFDKGRECSKDKEHMDCLGETKKSDLPETEVSLWIVLGESYRDLVLYVPLGNQEMCISFCNAIINGHMVGGETWTWRTIKKTWKYEEELALDSRCLTDVVSS